jgi:hypothetical protein
MPIQRNILIDMFLFYFFDVILKLIIYLKVIFKFGSATSVSIPVRVSECGVKELYHLPSIEVVNGLRRSQNGYAY